MTGRDQDDVPPVQAGLRWYDQAAPLMKIRIIFGLLVASALIGAAGKFYHWVWFEDLTNGHEATTSRTAADHATSSATSATGALTSTPSPTPVRRPAQVDDGAVASTADRSGLLVTSALHDGLRQVTVVVDAAFDAIRGTIGALGDGPCQWLAAGSTYHVRPGDRRTVVLRADTDGRIRFAVRAPGGDASACPLIAPVLSPVPARVARPPTSRAGTTAVPSREPAVPSASPSAEERDCVPLLDLIGLLTGCR